jgi:hypothetical protein
MPRPRILPALMRFAGQPAGLLASSLAFLYMALAVAGGIRGYSPVPLDDMWGGYLGFYLSAAEGGLDAWWAQYNEHRILLPRILFYIDIAWFHGRGVLPLVATYVTIGASFLVLLAALNEKLRGSEQAGAKVVVASLVLILLFSFVQRENLIWAFQCQFFLNLFLALAAFYALHKAHAEPARSRGFFILASLAGIASAGTMANGVIVLPLLGALALVLRMGWRRVVILSLLSVVLAAAYFYDYRSPMIRGSMTSALLTEPVAVLRFTLVFLGGPFARVTPWLSMAIAEMAGLAMILGALLIGRATLRTRASLDLALLTFVIFVGASAVATALGRVEHGGLWSALSGRYTTPALMGWATLAVLGSPSIARAFASRRSGALVPLALIPVLLWPTQITALTSHEHELFERRVGALAILLGVEDQAILGPLAPQIGAWAPAVRLASEGRVSIFGSPDLLDVDVAIGRPEPERVSARCLGNLESVTEVAAGATYQRVQGWLFDQESRASPARIRLLDGSGEVVGYALTGGPRPDVAATASPQAGHSGFLGYVRSDHAGDLLILRGIAPDCELPIHSSD